MIAKHKLTKVTLKHNDGEIIVFLGWHFVIIIMLIEMIKTIMKEKLQEPEQNIPRLERGQLSFWILLLQYMFSCQHKIRCLLWSQRPVGTSVDRQCFLPTHRSSVFQSWNQRIRSSMPIYPFAPGIVFQLAWRLIISSQMQNTNTPSALILGYKDLQLRIHSDLKALPCCKHQTNGKSLADITLSLMIKWE